MTDISKEAIASAWEEFEVCARPSGLLGDLELYDTDGMGDHAYTLHQIAIAQAARIEQLEAQERKSRGYRVGHIAGYHAALRDALECIGHITQSEDRDAILALINKAPTP